MDNKEALKRLIRVMNSVLNITDYEEIPEEITQYLYYPVGQIAEMLNIPVIWRKTKEKDENGEYIMEIEKFVMPEDFDKWVETNGKENGT